MDMKLKLNNTENTDITTDTENMSKENEKDLILSPIKKTNENLTFVKENLSSLKVLLALSCVVALLTTIFFSSEYQGYIGLIIYTFILSIILCVYLNKLKLFVNKKAIWLLVAINLIALSNSFFETNYHLLNILAIHLLFSLFLTKATNINYANYYGLDIFLRIFKNFFVSIETISYSISEVFQIKNDSKKLEVLKNIAIGIIIAIPFVFIVVILLTSIDSNFEKTINIFFDLEFINSYFLYRIFYFLIAVFVFISYSFKIYKSREEKVNDFTPFKFNSTVASTFLTLLNILYIIFLFIQVQYIFQYGFLVLPDGFDYYEYAHYGFFPTVAITIINLFVVLVITEFTKVDFKSSVFKINFFIIFLSNIFFIFNGLMRIYMYISEYGYTIDRNYATLFLVFELITMVITILKLTKGVNFYKYTFISFVMIYIIGAYVGNDYLCTKLNFEKFDITAEDFEKSYGDEIYFYRLHIDKEYHSLSFDINSDSLGYLCEHFDVNEDVLELYYPINRNEPFYSKTFFMLKYERENPILLEK
ncbi:MAG: DUF4153 domain-containing protein [Lachnospirales bacterium]